MPKESGKRARRFHEPVPYFAIKRTTQISESHCGPAVIQMLLSNLAVDTTQEAVAAAGGATALIELHGMRVDQLALAVCLLAPTARFWYKEKAKLEDIVALIKDYGYPVGVEWQGYFDGDEEDDEEDEDEDDYGHYSVVTQVDRERQEMIVVDPYKDYVSRDHILGFDEFETRWWDYNEVKDERTGRRRLVKDDHLLFIITPREENFPTALGMTPGAGCEHE